MGGGVAQVRLYKSNVLMQEQRFEARATFPCKSNVSMQEQGFHARAMFWWKSNVSMQEQCFDARAAFRYLFNVNKPANAHWGHEEQALSPHHACYKFLNTISRSWPPIPFYIHCGPRYPVFLCFVPWHFCGAYTHLCFASPAPRLQPSLLLCALGLTIKLRNV